MCEVSLTVKLLYLVADLGKAKDCSINSPSSKVFAFS